VFTRKSDLFLLYLAVNFALVGLMFCHSALKRAEAQPALMEKAEMVRRLELTDLCLFTDARYTRHPSVADIHTPFQDYPLSLDHFPSGSIIAPPPHLKTAVTGDK